jgi:hypothetical protein
MPKATVPGGPLKALPDCWIKIPISNNPPAYTVDLYALPDISDSKSASYNDEPIIGRAFPLKTYSHSDNRTISMQLHLFVTHPDDVDRNLNHLRVLESAVYPRVDQISGAPFIPPPVCRIQCGKILGDEPLCVVLKQYSVKFPIDVAWDERSYLPWKFDVDTTWEVVYKAPDLPGQTRIVFTGR